MILDMLFKGNPRLPIPETRANWLEQNILPIVDYSSSGVVVTPDTALTNAAVYACVRILAETLASLPLITYVRLEKGRERATNYYLYPLLHDEPNEWMTSFEFRETLQGHLALWGNAYSQIEYAGSGRIGSLFPLRPDKMHDLVQLEGQWVYVYELPNGSLQAISAENIWHLKAFGDGRFGYSPIMLMRNSVGLGLAMEKFGGKFFGNGARPGGVLEHPGKLGTEAQKRLRESWNESHGGLDNAHKVAILEEGIKWHDIGVPPEAAQYLESRKFQATEIARMFRIPPHMIADLDRATFSNIEQQSLEFVTYTMMPWLTRWEQSIKKNLMLPGDRKRYYVEFLVDGLLRGDVTSRTAYYSTGRQWGWLSTNDVREKENMNPIEGGDDYLTPMNMMAAGEGDQATSQSGDPDQTRAENRETRVVESREERAKKQAGGRFRLARRQQVVFEDVARRIMRRERNDVGKTARKMLGKEPVTDFERWLKEFYREHAGWSAGQMGPSMQAYGAMIADRVADELNQDNLDGRTDAFVAAYAEEFGKRVSTRSLTRLQDKIAKRGAMTDEELQAEIEEELDGWVEDRPANIGKEESVRENNAVALALYAQMGIEKIMSVATGESDCPYCEDLDGQVIGINQFFLKTGQEFQPEGAQGPLTVGNDMRHPPFHDSCDCVVISV